MSMLGLGVTGIAFAAAPISAVWLLNAWWLGRKQERIALSLGTRTPEAAPGARPALATD